MLVVFYMAILFVVLVCMCMYDVLRCLPLYDVIMYIIIALIHFLYCTKQTNKNKIFNLTTVASGSLQSHQTGWAMPQIRRNYCNLV